MRVSDRLNGATPCSAEWSQCPAARAPDGRALWRPYRRAAKTDTRLAEHAGYLYARAPVLNYSARRPFQGLRADCGYTGSYETVKRFVRPLRRLQAQPEGTLTRCETVVTLLVSR